MAPPAVLALFNGLAAWPPTSTPNSEGLAHDLRELLQSAPGGAMAFGRWPRSPRAPADERHQRHPLVDVMLVLVVIFCITLSAPFAGQRRSRLDLPKWRQPLGAPGLSHCRAARS